MTDFRIVEKDGKPFMLVRAFNLIRQGNVFRSEKVIICEGNQTVH